MLDTPVRPTGARTIPLVQPRKITILPLDWFRDIPAEKDCDGCSAPILNAVIEVEDGLFDEQYIVCLSCADEWANKTGAVDRREATGTAAY